MQQAPYESTRITEPKMFENFRFPAEIPMIRFYCNTSKCSGSFIVAFNERHVIANSDANICPKCGNQCSISKMRRVRPI